MSNQFKNWLDVAGGYYEGLPYLMYSARDLQERFGYSSWKNFQGAVNKTRQTLLRRNGVEHLDLHVYQVEEPSGRGRPRTDYLLSEDAACILVLHTQPRTARGKAAKRYVVGSYRDLAKEMGAQERSVDSGKTESKIAALRKENDELRQEVKELRGSLSKIAEAVSRESEMLELDTDEGTM